MIRNIARVVGVVSLMLAAASLLAQEPQAFDAAVVTEEGLLTPFARFDGATWERLWREPGEKPASAPSLPVPREWYPPDGQAPKTWHLWLMDDPRAAASPFEQRAARALAVHGLEVFPAHCLSQVGLRVDYRGPDARQVPANQFPKRKAGIALSVGSPRIDPPTVIEPDSPLAKVVLDRATQPFHRAEEDQIEILDARERTKLQIPPFTTRRGLPVKWTRVTRVGTAQASERVYYLEGEVEYSSSAIMSGHVWVQMSGGRDTVDADVVLTDSDRKLARSRTALGVIRAGDRRFWIFETSQWEHETYEVIEVSGGQRPSSLLEVAAGGC
jgi:hypothetical protein